MVRDGTNGDRRVTGRLAGAAPRLTSSLEYFQCSLHWIVSLREDQCDIESFVKVGSGRSSPMTLGTSWSCMVRRSTGDTESMSPRAIGMLVVSRLV